jgi:hypothetical protein
MPSIIPSYVYTLFASLIVGTIVVCACGILTLNIKNIAEDRQLVNISEYVAVQSNELVLRAARDNMNSTVYVNVPSSIGNKQYWIQIANDTTQTWVAAGFGAVGGSSEQLANIPAQVDASGIYSSYTGKVILECQTDSLGVHLKIYGEN